MPWILVRLQALEYALLHHSHVKNPKWTIPLSFIHLYYFQATFSRLDGSKEYINYQLLLELSEIPEIPEIPNQTLQVKRWLKEPTKLSEFDSLIYMSFHEQTLLESRSQTCDGSTCYFAADLSKDWQEENNQQHTQYVSICIDQESETHSTHQCLFHQE